MSNLTISVIVDCYEVMEEHIVVFPNGQTWHKVYPPIVNQRVAVLQVEQMSLTRMVVSRDLRDIADLQLCLNATNGFDCSIFDEVGNHGGQVNLEDLPEFIDALNRSLPGCVTR